ncbi:MAG: hypothetical protein IT299_03730 [Dehalococcoidia bacterium]|nr:hypothetical protein [Dehalococcoidia bacterium]
MTMRPRTLALLVAAVAALGWLAGLPWPLVGAAAAATAFILVILTRPLPPRRPFADEIPRQLDEARAFSLANAVLWGGLAFGFLNGSGSASASDVASGLDAGGGLDVGGGLEGFDAGGFSGGGPE